MKRYARYKDSGIEWLGDIPEHWEVKKLKYISETVLGKMLTPNDKGGYVLKPYLRAANLEWLTVNVDDVKQMWFSEKELETYRLKYLDLLVSEGGEVGRTCIWRDELEECYIQNSVHKLSFNKNLNPVFFLYQFFLMGQKGVFDSIVNRISIAHLTGEKIKDIYLWYPSIEEQTAIADFLDRKTAELDRLIEKKTQLIRLYEEQKAALINQAVTRGLDPQARLKPSGLDWLGPIPAHWEVKKLKYMSETVLGKMLTPNDKGGYVLKPYLRAANLEWLTVNVNDVKEMWFSKKEIEKYRLKYFDLLVSEGGEVGRTCIWKDELEECYIQNSVHKITFKEHLNPMFFLYQFFLMGQKGVFDSIVNRISIAHLTGEKIKDIYLWYPSLEEQAAIVTHIEHECARLDALLARFRQQIELFQEYRAALISEAVTGKIDLRDW
jgi:type I restriction enzyme S subunit